jgi:hypothetical protein
LHRPTPLRRELLLSFGVLFAGAVLLAGLGLAFLTPVLASPGEGVLFIIVLVVADLGVLFVFGSALLTRTLFSPMERLAADARRIGEGDYHYRIPAIERLELDQIRESVNAMADRLITEQRLLAENVDSLDRTNEELVLARDQVVQAARLASVGTLAAGIAHEVGNPLGAIMAFVDVAKSRIERTGGDTELLDSIRNEARRIDRIVRGLLDHARPRHGEAHPVAAAAVVERVRELMDSQGKLDAVDDAWSIEEGVPDVLIEPQGLEQVLVNLVLNALDALGGTPSPHVWVRLSAEEGGIRRLPRRRADDPPGINYLHRRRVAARDPRGIGVDPLFTAARVVVIAVEDDGPGIPDDDLERVFDPFFTTKEPGKGTGLGLSICARLVEGMGGRIQVSNRPGGGASFTVRLPGVPEGVDVRGPKDETSANLVGEKR